MFSLCLNSFVVILPKDANFASDELRNFPTKLGVKFTTSFRSSWFDWQLRNEIAKLIVNLGNSEQTSEPVRQKLCETLCNCYKSTQQMRSILREFPAETTASKNFISTSEYDFNDQTINELMEFI